MRLKLLNFQASGNNCGAEIYRTISHKDEMTILVARRSTSMLIDMHVDIENIMRELEIKNFKYE